MIAWLRMKLNSAISCVVGAHHACDGWAVTREPLSGVVLCHCNCHAAEVAAIAEEMSR